MKPNPDTPPQLIALVAKPSQACRRREKGLTLVELLVVLGILVGVGSIAITSFSDVTVRGADGVDREPEEVATLATMQEVREALLGASSSEPGYRQDVGNLPSRLGGLIENIDGALLYEPARKRGWRGPYLYDAGTRYGAPYVETGDGFPTSIPNTDPVILDAWGKPLLLQEPGTEDARLVSAGPNRTLETDDSNAIDSNRGDDIVLFLLTSDPNL